MKRTPIVSLVSAVLIVMSVTSTTVHADFFSDQAAKARARSTASNTLVRAKSAERIALVHAGAIVLAGVAIGAGIFFGLRSRSGKDTPRD
jgi:hypothetical protein